MPAAPADPGAPAAPPADPGAEGAIEGPGAAGAVEGPPAGGARPAVVLARPQLPENVGAAARAMACCGLSDLRLAAPRAPFDAERALAAAGRGSGAARRVVERARVFPGLPEALADLDLVWASSARPRDLAVRVEGPEAAADELLAACAAGRRAGLLFGPERTGLENGELAWADAVLRFPTAPGARSLNLAQAVLLAAWHLRARGRWAEEEEGAEPPPPGARAPAGAPGAPPASRGEVAGLLRRLEAALERAGYFPPSPGTERAMRLHLRGLLVRAAPSAQEVRTLEGVLRALEGRRAARAPAAPPAP